MGVIVGIVGVEADRMKHSNEHEHRLSQRCSLYVCDSVSSE